jgi:hypothetical protein
MNCAWCSPSNDGSDGICDACMLLYFGVDPTTIHAEIEAEEAEHEEQTVASYGILAVSSDGSYPGHGMLYSRNLQSAGYAIPCSGENKGGKRTIRLVAAMQ